MDVNQVSKKELQTIPGVGPKTAEKIIAARPIKDVAEFEALIPPMAVVEIHKSELRFEFGPEGTPEEGDLPMAPPVEATTVKAEISVEEAIDVLRRAGHPLVNKSVDVGSVQLRRILPTEQARFQSLFDTGAKFLCVWNMKWGPQMEAISPQDQPIQAEITEWFQTKGMEILFAHYGPSAQIKTRSRGFVPVVLFEILEEEENANQESA